MKYENSNRIYAKINEEKTNCWVPLEMHCYNHGKCNPYSAC